MKKTYMMPAIQADKAQAANMIAVSLQDGKADGSEVLTKENNDWDIWEE